MSTGVFSVVTGVLNVSTGLAFTVTGHTWLPVLPWGSVAVMVMSTAPLTVLAAETLMVRTVPAVPKVMLASGMMPWSEDVALKVSRETSVSASANGSGMAPVVDPWSVRAGFITAVKTGAPGGALKFMSWRLGPTVTGLVKPFGWIETPVLVAVSV